MHTSKRRLFALCLTVLLLSGFLPIAASANSPPPEPWYSFVVTNLPKGTVYVDLLIRMESTDPLYEELVEENVPDSFATDADILSYCENGYLSYTFHYRGARSEIQLQDGRLVHFFADSALMYEFRSTGHEQDVEKRGKICLAMLDSEGNILKVSSPQSLKPKGLFANSTGVFRYDASADQMTVDSRSNVMNILVFIIIGIAGIVVTCTVEWLVSLFFDIIKDHSRLIVCTNIISQLLMRVGQVLLLRLLFACGLSFDYPWIVLLLEIPVYVCEFLVYKKRIWDASWQRCLLYTVCANTASALLGLWMLNIVF